MMERNPALERVSAHREALILKNADAVATDFVRSQVAELKKRRAARDEAEAEKAGSRKGKN